MALESYIKNRKTAVLSFSGGLDSTSLLLHLLNNNYDVYSLTFNYGQRHHLEIEKAKNNIALLNSLNFNINHQIINISDCINILSSSITDKNVDIPEGYYKEESMKSTVVPNRNAIFTSIIYGYALSISKKINNPIEIALGVHAGDHTIYPDCRKEFYIKIIDAFKEGNWNTNEISLYLPYINLNKSDILKDAQKSTKNLKLDFNLIFKNTLTSYNPDKYGKSNGKTSSDVERILAFNQIGLKDPIEYLDNWENILKHAKKIEKEFKKKY